MVDQKAKKYEDFKVKIKTCDACFSKASKVELFSTGNPESKVMLIAYTPYPDGGTDPTLRLLGAKLFPLYKELFSILNLPIDKVWITTCCKCFSGNKIGSAMQCRKHIMEEIELVNPSLIIAVGERVYTLLAGNKTYIPGKEEKFGTRKLVPIISPETVVRSPQFKNYFLSTAKVASKSISQPNLDWFS